MAQAEKHIRVALTKDDLIKAASSVPGVLNARTAASATRVEFQHIEPGSPASTSGVIAVVTFIFDKNAPVE